MKIKKGVLAVFLLYTLLTPLLFTNIKDKLYQPQKNTPEDISTTATAGETITLSDQGKIITLSLEEYVTNALCCEINPTYHTEALKAQAVALRTYAIYCKQNKPQNQEYDIAVDSSSCSGYADNKTLQKMWGNQFSNYYNIMSNATKETSGLVVIYSGKLTVPAWFAFSSGHTESSKDMWQNDQPYLIGVNSQWDLLATDYTAAQSFTPQQIKDALKELQIVFSGDEQQWFSNLQTTQNKGVIKLDICGQSITGMQLYQALSLCSTCFTVTYSNGEFVFETLGFGHGVGMSQYGADYLAQQGKSYEEILSYYFTGTAVQEISTLS